MDCFGVFIQYSINSRNGVLFEWKATKKYSLHIPFVSVAVAGSRTFRRHMARQESDYCQDIATTNDNLSLFARRTHVFTSSEILYRNSRVNLHFN